MNNDNYKFNNDIDFNKILLNENISKRQQESFYINFKNKMLLNYEILKDNIYNIFNYYITNIKNIIKKYKYSKLNTYNDMEDNINNDIYTNKNELNYYQYYENKYNKSYFNYELNNVNMNSVDSIKNKNEIIQKPYMENSLNLDLTSTINTDEIYNNTSNILSNSNFSVTRVNSVDSFDSFLSNSLINSQ